MAITGRLCGQVVRFQSLANFRASIRGSTRRKDDRTRTIWRDREPRVAMRTRNDIDIRSGDRWGTRFTRRSDRDSLRHARCIDLAIIHARG